MPFSQESGYIPAPIQTILNDLMTGINAQFSTNYTPETFVGSGFYKYAYAMAQKIQEGEIKTSEVFLKMTQYFIATNQRISRAATTPPGIIERLAEAGFIASVKPMIEEDAGKIHICVDVDDTSPDYATTKVEICELISRVTALGCVTMGDQEEEIVLSNGQAFDFKYSLPDRIDTLLRLTITTSVNNQVLIDSPDDVKTKLMSNISERYRLGLNFEPQKYFSLSDAPWASQVKLEWAEDGDTPSYSTDVFEAEFDEILNITLENITVVED